MLNVWVDFQLCVFIEFLLFLKVILSKVGHSFSDHRRVGLC